MTNRKEPIPAIFYARVSTDGQDRKLSHEEQEELGREMARREGYNIMRFLREVASATGTDKRPVFRDAMNLAMSPKHPARAYSTTCPGLSETMRTSTSTGGPSGKPMSRYARLKRAT